MDMGGINADTAQLKGSQRSSFTRTLPPFPFLSPLVGRFYFPPHPRHLSFGDSLDLFHKYLHTRKMRLHYHHYAPLHKLKIMYLHRRERHTATQEIKCEIEYLSLVRLMH